MNPWEKYAQDTAASTTGPWDKYRADSTTPPAQGSTVAPLDRLPTDAPGGNQPAKNADDIAHRLLGVGEAGLSAVTGAVGGAAGQLYGIGKTLTGGKFGTQQGIQEGEKAGVDLANRLTYQPRTQTGKDLTEGAGKLMDASRLQGLPVEAGMMNRIPDVPRGALAAGEGAAGAVRKGVQGVGNAAGRAVTSALPEVDPQTLNLARQAHSMGFRLTPDMVYGNKYARGAGELAQDNPFVGKTVREHNQQVFNSHLVNAIGGEGDKLTRKTFADAMDRSGKTIGTIAEKYPLPLDQSFIGKLRANGANQLPEVRSVVDKYVDQIDSAAGKPETLVGGGRTAAPRELPGPVFRRINTSLSKQIRETTNGDLRSALRGVQDDLLEERSQHMSQSDLDAYNEARRQYAIGSSLEPLVAKSSTGNISPAALLGVVTKNAAGKSAMARGAAGQLGTLADIGQRFLKERPSSGTAERGLLQNLMTHPVGSLAAGGTAALTAPVARAYNQFGPGVTQRLIDRPPSP